MTRSHHEVVWNASGTVSSTKRYQRGFSVTVLRVLPDHVVTVACAKPKTVIAARFSSEAGGHRCGLPENCLVELRGVVGWNCMFRSLPRSDAAASRGHRVWRGGTPPYRHSWCSLRRSCSGSSRPAFPGSLEAVRPRFLVRPPDFIDDVTQILCDKRIAVRMDLVRRVAHLDARTWVSPFANRGANGRLNFPSFGLNAL